MESPNQRPLKKRPLSPAIGSARTVPRGMWFEDRIGRELPFVARWRWPGGRKDSKAFSTAKEREEFATSWGSNKRTKSAAAKLVTAERLAIWDEFAIITAGENPLLVAREWLQAKSALAPLPIEEVWKLFNDDQEGRRLAGDTHSHRRLHGKRLLAFFKDWTIQDIGSDQLDQWLASLVDGATAEPMSAKSKLHHLKTCRFFFGWLKDRRKLEHNPADAVTVPDDVLALDAGGEPVHRDINILTIPEAQELFRANRDALCIGRLGLEAFGFLRFASAKRVRPQHINWKERGLEMPGHAHKSGERHYVDGWPPNLWRWMKRAPAACWDLPPRIYADLKREAFARAGLKPPKPLQIGDGRVWSALELEQFERMKNVLRHSGITYHLGAFQNPPLTLQLATKTSIVSLRRDYQGRATKAASLLYWKIIP